MASVLLALLLASAPAPARAAGRGLLVVQVDVVGATVELDGSVIGRSPLRAAVAASAGEHALKVWKLGHVPYLDVVIVERGGRRVVDVLLAPTTAVLLVATEPEDADVLVDGEFVGEAPVELELSAGPHLVRVERPGRLPAERMVVLGLGVVTSEVLTLVPEPGRPRAASRPVWKRGWFWTAAVAAAATTAYFVVPRPIDAAASADHEITVPGP